MQRLWTGGADTDGLHGCIEFEGQSVSKQRRLLLEDSSVAQQREGLEETHCKRLRRAQGGSHPEDVLGYGKNLGGNAVETTFKDRPSERRRRSNQ